MYTGPYTVMSHLTAHFGSQGIWLYKREMPINETSYYTWY